MVEEAELANYKWWDESEKVQWKKFDPINDTAVTSTNNKRYTKVDEYKVLFTKEDNIKSVEYEEKLIEYEENYESYNPYQDWDGLKIFY